MKNVFPFLIIIGGISLLITGCTDTAPKQVLIKKSENITSQSSQETPSQLINAPQQPDSMTDPRDGEVYKTVIIGNRTWLAENLRYNMEGSMLSPDNPPKSYGRLYELVASQSACPDGWHLPTENEWDDLEVAHGMPDSFRGEGGWRGEHAVNLKSTTGWDQDGNGTDSLGFNVLPAGYFFSGNMGGERGIHGVGYSAAFWSYLGDRQGAARFMFSPPKFVNKWEDDDNGTGVALSCRCVKD